MHVYIPTWLLGGLCCLVMAVPLGFMSFLVVALVGIYAGFVPPKGVDGSTMALIVIGQFIGGMVWGWASKEWMA